MTFPTEVLVNDRWTINLALETFSEIVGVKSLIDSEDLHEGTKKSSTALLIYILTSGLQFCQAKAVVDRMEVLHKQKELCGHSGEDTSHNQENLLAKLDKELCWIMEAYDHEKCKEWTEHAKIIQAKVRDKIEKMLHSRFCQVKVPRPMTINRLATSLVINLGLTGGSGFYLTDCKETLWPGRKLVVQDKKTGEYYEDFSGYHNHRGTVREMLGLHSHDIAEVNPTQHPDHLLFFESTSRNRMLKANTSFLYQVFPGTTGQCRRQLIRAARTGEIDTIQKLLLFFAQDKDFVNGRDTETGNTALHVASRNGYLEVMQVLLEHRAQVDPVNNAGSTPFFLATEGLHKTASLLLLEWGADIRIKNRMSKTALDLTRNADLKTFLSRKYGEYQQLQSGVRRGDCLVLERHIDKHIDGTDPMASLTSRCVRGSTLLHAAASTCSLTAVKKLLSQQVRPDIRDVHGATPLHITRDPIILQEMLEHDGDVNSVDDRGNSPLHCMCSENQLTASLPDCVTLLIGRSASPGLHNHTGHLPIHCASACGLTSVIECLLSCGPEAGLTQDDLQQLLQESPLPSLPYLALRGNYLHCSQWLVERGFLFKTEELDTVLLKLLLPDQITVSQLKEAVRFVVEQGADVTTSDKKGNRPLHVAAGLTDHPEVVEVLLEAGADPDTTNSTLATPLIIACQTNNLFAARALLSKGASVDVRDAVGKCAFEYISDFEEWIQCGHFSHHTVTLLRGFKFRQGKQLVASLCTLLNTSPHHNTSF